MTGNFQKLSAGPPAPVLPVWKQKHRARRVIAIAGPTAEAFRHTCRALKIDQQSVATGLVDGWNRRNAKRARHALEQQAAALGQCASARSSAKP